MCVVFLMYRTARSPAQPKKICFGCCLTAVLTPPVHRSCLRVRWARMYMLYNSGDEEEGKNYIQKKRQRGLLLSSFFAPKNFRRIFSRKFSVMCAVFVVCSSLWPENANRSTCEDAILRRSWREIIFLGLFTGFRWVMEEFSVLAEI